MCEVSIHLKEKDKKEEVLLEGISFIKFHRGKILVSNLYGQERIIKGIVREIDFMKHKVVIEKAGDNR